MAGEPFVFYVLKRPFVDFFLRQVCQWYDVVIFTASLRKYADPVIDMLQSNGAIVRRLFRDACLLQQGIFMKDLSVLCSDYTSILIVDNSPGAYQLQRGAYCEEKYLPPLIVCRWQIMLCRSKDGTTIRATRSCSRCCPCCMPCGMQAMSARCWSIGEG